MSTQYVGEIRLFPYTFAPVGWALCNGQLLPISEYEVLYTLLGTTYGGNGVQTFALPDLRGRIPVHQGTSIHGTSFTIGELTGEETVTLTTSQIPSHSHAVACSNGGPGANAEIGTPQNSPSGAYWNKWPGSGFSNASPNSNLHSAAVALTGGNQPHDNMPPFLAINFAIALFGIYPSPN